MKIIKYSSEELFDCPCGEIVIELGDPTLLAVNADREEDGIELFYYLPANLLAVSAIEENCRDASGKLLSTTKIYRYDLEYDETKITEGRELYCQDIKTLCCLDCKTRFLREDFTFFVSNGSTTEEVGYQSTLKLLAEAPLEVQVLNPREFTFGLNLSTPAGGEPINLLSIGSDNGLLVNGPSLDANNGLVIGSDGGLFIDNQTFFTKTRWWQSGAVVVANLRDSSVDVIDISAAEVTGAANGARLILQREGAGGSAYLDCSTSGETILRHAGVQKFIARGTENISRVPLYVEGDPALPSAIVDHVAYCSEAGAMRVVDGGGIVHFKRTLFTPTDLAGTTFTGTKGKAGNYMYKGDEVSVQLLFNVWIPDADVQHLTTTLPIVPTSIDRVAFVMNYYDGAVARWKRGVAFTEASSVLRFETEDGSDWQMGVTYWITCSGNYFYY